MIGPRDIQIVIPHCPHREAEICRLMQSLEASDWPLDESPPIVSFDSQKNQARNALLALKLGVRTGAEWILHLENDVIVNRHLFWNLQTYPQLWSVSFVTLYSCVKPSIQIGENIRRIEPYDGWGAQGILLRRSAAEYAIRHWSRINGFADLRMFRLVGEVSPIEMHIPSLVQHTGRSGANRFHEVDNFAPDFRREVRQS
ncbi:MAG: hypothetical protein R3C01_07100 [Planctomycetaceae bacterium]